VTLVVPARAKLNLDLAVLGRTEDGFHEIRTRIQAIALHDVLELAKADRTAITISGASGVNVRGVKDNSVLKAHAAIQEEAGRALPTRFHLDKHIPAGSGMGGASSDAAAALRGLVAMYNLKLDLARIAEGIGADVPFFVSGGGARAEGRGERLTALPTEHTWFAIAWPSIELSTQAVYRAWDEVQGDGANQLTRAAFHVEPRLQDFARNLGDDWQMTGSGSAFFRPCRDEPQAIKAIANLDCWTAVTHSVGAWA
jgi:4-diphosphocytidyl-2-C-methyl-D-erythritol kinase